MRSLKSQMGCKRRARPIGFTNYSKEVIRSVAIVLGNLQGHPPHVDEWPPSLFLVRLLFRLRGRRLFARWWNDVLEPHVCDKIAVVFHVVHVVNVQHTEFGHVHAE